MNPPPRTLTKALLILSAIPGIILIPIAPFTFFILDGEGRVPGLLHEYAFMTLLLLYPFLLGGCGWFVVGARRWGWVGVGASVIPLVCFLVLVWVFVVGGVRLR